MQSEKWLIMKNNTGFTLVELIIVIAILSILSAITVQGFFSLSKISNLDNNVQEFASVLRLAQNESLLSENSSQYGVYINTGLPNQYVLFKGASYTLRDVSADQVYSLQAEGSYKKTVYIANSGTVNFSQPVAASDSNRLKDSRHVQFNYSRIIDAANENIILTFDNSEIRIIPISSYLAGGEFQWQDNINIGGVDQTVEINTRGLSSSDILFNILRDRGYANKSLKITISGDSSGSLAEYPADGLTAGHSSIYVSNFALQ